MPSMASLWQPETLPVSGLFCKWFRGEIAHKGDAYPGEHRAIVRSQAL